VQPARGPLGSRPARYAGLVALASLLALSLYLYVTGTGLAGTSDTDTYLYVARALRQTGQLRVPDARLHQVWPPLFSAVLAVIGFPGPVRWLNGLALLGALLAWSASGWALLRGRRVWALPLLLALGSPALVVSKFIWSESLFNLLWAGYFLALLSWLRRGGWGWGLLATGLGCLLPLQRIAGLFLLAGAGVGLAWPRAGQWRRPGRWAQLGHLVGAASGFLLWKLGSGSAAAAPILAPITFRTPPVPPPSHLLADYSFVLGRWLAPLPAALRPAVPAGIWVAVLGLLLLALWPRPAGGQCPDVAFPAWRLAGMRILFLSLLSTIALLGLAAWLGRIGHDTYEAERYLTALYPPVLLLLLWAWPAQARWARRMGPVLLAALVLYQGIRTGNNVPRLRRLPPASLETPPAFRPLVPAGPALHR